MYNMQKVRDPSFDVFRGVAIIAVVAIHAILSVTMSEGPGITTWNACFLAGYIQLFWFCVPAFVFISGYWLSGKQINSLRDYKDFLVKRVLRVFIPYLFWSLVLLGYVSFKTHDFDANRIAWSLLLGRAVYTYYFIILIIQFYVLTPLLQYINRKTYGFVFVLAFNMVTLAVLYLPRLNIIGYVPELKPFYSWIIFFQMGIFVGSRNYVFPSGKKINLLILSALLVSLLLSEAEAMITFLKYDKTVYAYTALKYSSFLYSACIISGFLLIKQHLQNWPRWLVRIGEYSFGIYLIHMVVLKGIVSIVQKNSFIWSHQPLYQLAVVFMTILICCVLINFTRKVLPKSFCNRILGF
jgi:surface polysaccharide O-acyltransferase-like enzyme